MENNSSTEKLTTPFFIIPIQKRGIYFSIYLILTIAFAFSYKKNDFKFELFFIITLFGILLAYFLFRASVFTISFFGSYLILDYKLLSKKVTIYYPEIEKIIHTKAMMRKPTSTSIKLKEPKKAFEKISFSVKNQTQIIKFLQERGVNNVVIVDSLGEHKAKNPAL